jgi:hypothetical protein
MMSQLIEDKLKRMLEFASVPQTAPLRLHLAAAIAFPDGSMTVSGLRREAKRGNLTIEVIAGKQYVTLAAIKEMRSRCRAQNNRPDSGFVRCERGVTKERPAPSGSSSMGENTSPRDALLAKIDRRKSACRPTSEKSMRLRDA